MKALLELRGARRDYPSGEGVFTALKDIDLDIYTGEMVAIIGPSGSGKSTLMNILGCLDRLTSGTFQVAGQDTAHMDADDLAALRRERFGFVFQRYNLLPDLTALGNVEVPAIYAGRKRTLRQARAVAILSRLKLDDRLMYRPNKLSGGQQQRVSIARALINGGEIILADEPTGALDSHVGEEVLAILRELHAQGHTVVIVTHDAKVSQYAQRIIELRDGEIIADRKTSLQNSQQPNPIKQGRAIMSEPLHVILDRSLEAFHMALLAMNAHRLRTCLTMLGIMIGIASVVSVVAMGNGTEEKVLQSISALGTNTLDVYPGTGLGDIHARDVQTLRATDALELASQPFVDSATPVVSTSTTGRYGNAAANAEVYGVGGQFFRVKGMKLIEGSTFDTSDVNRIDQCVVIDENARKQLFGSLHDSPVGKIILLGRVPSRVIGVVKRPGNLFTTALSVWVPYTTVMVRMLGQSYVSGITVRVSDNIPMQSAEQAITRLLSVRHGRKDFFVQSTAQIREAFEATARTMTLLIGSIAAISLLVGGIGVMNIMLVSVTERTREIGVRIAVGGRQSDIRQQFLIEAVLVCLIGGALGVLLAFGVGTLLKLVGNENFPMIFSIDSIIAAFICSTVIGIIFGFVPAGNAARLDPVEALARE